MIQKDANKGIDGMEILKLRNSHVEMSLALQYANKSIAVQGEKLREGNEQIVVLKTDIKMLESFKRKYIVDLDKINHFVSHLVRTPISQLVGISKLLRFQKNSVGDVKQMVVMIGTSASKLDSFTKKLTALIKKIRIRSSPR